MNQRLWMLLLLVGTAHAQEGGSNTQDELFVRQAAIGGRAEVELGKIAQKKASTDSVRQFARHMVDAHSKNSQQLMRAGKGLNPEPPKDLDPEHLRIRDELNQKSGRDFDVAYIASQLTDHQRTANLLQWQISSGQNEALKKYSIETLPVVMEHLEMAKEQYAMLTMGAGKPR